MSRTLPRTLLAAAPVAAIALAAAAATGGTATAAPGTTPTPTSALSEWYFGAAPALTSAVATTIAHDYNVVIASPTAFAKYVPLMRAANPQLRFYAYLNGLYAGANQGSSFSAGWYLHDAAGNEIRSVGYGNYLMDPTASGWVANRTAECQAELARSGYDGCYIDMLGTGTIMPGYATGTAIDPATGAPFSGTQWLAATGALAGQVATAVGRPVIGNGLGSGPRYYNPSAPSSLLLGSITGGVAETWLRTASQPLSTFPSAKSWLQNVTMLSAAAASGKDALVMTKAWGTGTADQLEQWHRFAAASFLLGAAGQDAFCWLPGNSSSEAGDPLTAVPVGTPTGAFTASGGAYLRSFSNGEVVVNPTTSPVTVTLPGTFTSLSGAQVSSETLAPDTGDILTAVG